MPISFVEDKPSISFIPDEALPSPVLKKNQTIPPLSLTDKLLSGPVGGYIQENLGYLTDPKNIPTEVINGIGASLGHPNLVNPIPSTHYTEQDIKGGGPVGIPALAGLMPLKDLRTGKDLVQPPIDPNTVIGALRLMPDRIIDAITKNPEQLFLGASGSIANLARALFGGTMFVQGGSTAVNPKATPGERVTGAVEAALGGLGTRLTQAKVKPASRVSDIEPSEFRKAGVENEKGDVIMPQYQNRTDAPQLYPPGMSEIIARANAMEEQAKALQRPDRQLSERAQSPIDVAKQEAEEKLKQSQNLPGSKEGFVSRGEKVASAGDAVKVSELTRPIAFIEDRHLPEPVLPREEGSSPKIISGATSATGETGNVPVTKEMLEASSGPKPFANKDEAAKAFHDNLVSLKFAVRGGDNEHAQEIWKRNEKIKNDWFGGQTPEKVVEASKQMELMSGAPLPKEQTEEFKRWFAGSKVVNEKNEPQVVYHGAFNPNFSSFSTHIDNGQQLGPGAYFTPSGKRASEFYTGGSGATFPVYVSLKNPFTIANKSVYEEATFKFKDSNPKEYQRIASKIWQQRYGKNDRNENRASELVNRNAIFNEYLKEQGYDGVLEQKQHLGKPWITEVVAFKPEQIKSIFNQGEWSPNNPHMLHSGVELPKEITDSIKRALGFVKQGNFTPLDKLPDKIKRVNPETPTKLEESLSKAITNPIESRDVSRSQPGEKLSLVDAAKNSANNVLNKLSYADKMLMPVDAIFDRLDSNKGDYEGWLSSNVRKPIDDRFKYELNLRDSMLDPVTQMVKKYKMNEQNAERIGVYAHSLQKNGTERMLKSGVTQETIDKVLKTITPEEKLVYNTMRQMMDNSLPAVQSVMKELYNQDVKPVENYFPMPRDYQIYEPTPDTIAKGEFDEHGTWRQLSGDYIPSGNKTEQGFTIARKPGSKTAIKVNAFDIYQQHIRDVSHLIAMQKELNEIGKTVRRPMFAEKYGDVGQKLVLDWLNTVARQGKSGKQVAFLDAIRNNTSKSIIGFRLASQLVHSANIPLAIQRAGANNWRHGLSDALTDEGKAFLKEHFPETFERGGGEPSLVDVSKNKKSGWVFGLQRKLDQMNTQATVLGVYRGELAKKGLNPNAYARLPVDKDAQSKALILARRAVASPLYKDIPPALARGGSLGKLFFQFQNTFLDQWSNIRHDLISAGIGKMNPALASQMAVTLATMMLIETGIKFGAKNAALIATGNPPEGEDKFWKRLETDALRRVPGMGQLMSEVLYGETGIPTVDVATGTVKGSIEAVTGKKIQGYPNAKPSDKISRQAAVEALASALELAGIPGTSQVAELIKDRMKAIEPVKEKKTGNSKSRFNK